MPVRFRCAYCNQLLGIARRKAGTVVRCPTCAGQIVVPPADAVEEAKAPSGASDPLVFERNDFEDLLTPAAGEPAARKQNVAASGDAPAVLPEQNPPEGAWGTHAEPAYDVERIPLASAADPEGLPVGKPAGRAPSSSRATLLLVGAVVVLAVTFAAGVLVGYFLRGAPTPS